jgi:hypothetical protein
MSQPFLDCHAWSGEFDMGRFQGDPGNVAATEQVTVVTLDRLTSDQHWTSVVNHFSQGREQRGDRRGVPVVEGRDEGFGPPQEWLQRVIDPCLIIPNQGESGWRVLSCEIRQRDRAKQCHDRDRQRTE